MALVGKRTAAAGGADATVNSVAGVWGVLDAALVAAGWTATTISAGSVWAITTPYLKGAIVTNSGNRYQCILDGTSSNATGPAGTSFSIPDGTCTWRFLTKIGDSDKIYTSTGESGNEKLYLRLYYQTATVAPFSVNVTLYQFWDSELGYNRIGPAGNAVTQFTFTAGNTVNFAVVADKDSFCGIFNDSANNRRVIGAGRLTRAPGINATFFTSNASVSTGSNKTFNFASGDPIAAGYKLGDRVFVVSQEPDPGLLLAFPSGVPFNQVAPLYAAKIVGLTTSSITIDYAPSTTQAGALIGADPQPLWFLTNTAQQVLSNANYVYANYRYIKEVSNLYDTTNERGYTSDGTGRSLVWAAAAELDPNARTSRVGMGEVALVSDENEICGIVPKYFWNPRTTDALWSIARSVKETTNYDYVTFPAITATPSGQIRETVGPFVVSGGSNYIVDYWKIDSDTYIEADTMKEISSTSFGVEIGGGGCDKALAVPVVPNQGYQFQGTLIGDDDNDVFAWALYLPNLVAQSSDKTGTNQYGFHAGETLPFDSPAAVVGGSGSAFNSGLN